MTDSSNIHLNLKEQNAFHIFSVTIRDRVHFYKIIKWLNVNVGKGSEAWSMEGKVLRTLNRGHQLTRKVYIFLPDFDISSALYLNLL